MALPEILQQEQREGGVRMPAPLDLAERIAQIQAQIQAAFDAGDFQKLAKLNAIANEISTRIREDLSRDSRYQRAQRNIASASPEDQEYMRSMTRLLGDASRLVGLTSRAAEASEQDIPTPGLSAAEMVGGRAAGLAGAQAALTGSEKIGRKFLKGGTQLQRSEAALKGAQRSMSGRAGAASQAANRAAQAARSATGRAGAAGAVASRASGAVESALDVVPAKVAPIRALEKTARQTARIAAGEKGSAAAARRTATAAGAKAATAKTAAKGFGATIARAAPKIFGGMALAEIELLVGPLFAFYENAAKMGDFFSTIEKMSELKGAPLEPDDFERGSDIERLGQSPLVADAMLAKGILSKGSYAYAVGPERAVAMGVYSPEEVQRPGYQPGFTKVSGRDIGPEPSLEPWAAVGGFASQRRREEESPSIGRIPGVREDPGAPDPDEPTPSVRRRVSERAFRASRPPVPPRPPVSPVVEETKEKGVIPDLAVSERPPDPGHLPGGAEPSGNVQMEEQVEQLTTWAEMAQRRGDRRSVPDLLKDLFNRVSKLDVGTTYPEDLG
jgi:hypothetical protein